MVNCKCTINKSAKRLIFKSKAEKVRKQGLTKLQKCGNMNIIIVKWGEKYEF